MKHLSNKIWERIEKKSLKNSFAEMFCIILYNTKFTAYVKTLDITNIKIAYFYTRN